MQVKDTRNHEKTVTLCDIKVGQTFTFDDWFLTKVGTRSGGGYYALPGSEIFHIHDGLLCSTTGGDPTEFIPVSDRPFIAITKVGLLNASLTIKPWPNETLAERRKEIRK